jgi:ATP-dependent DNA ligase
MVFDLLYWHRRNLPGRALRDRRARLEDAVAGSELVFSVRRLAADGPEAWQQVIVRRYEVWWPRTRPACKRRGRRGAG